MKKALHLAQILRHGMAAHRQGQLAEAERSYQAVLDAKRDDFDSLHLLRRLCRHIEAAYLTMREIHLAGESPRSFRVGPI
jgi:hypothetical protein